MRITKVTHHAKRRAIERRVVDPDNVEDMMNVPGILIDMALRGEEVQVSRRARFRKIIRNDGINSKYYKCDRWVLVVSGSVIVTIHSYGNQFEPIRKKRHIKKSRRS